MGTFLGAAGRREQPYFRASKGSCEIGWRRQDGAEIAIAALSGGEWVLFAAALTAAVIILRGAPLRVLLVEAGETDDQILGGLLAGIRAVADQLTCAIVATPRPAPAGSDDWTILTLDGAAALRPVAVA
jgi:S-formylglutathione hydrolase FrmB